MCLYPKLLQNPKYKPNKKNGGVPPKCTDKRTLLVPVGCGKCMECMKQKAGQWRARLHEEIKDWKGDEKHFITLTFSTKSLIELNKDIDPNLRGYERDNAIATLATRRFLERWRQRHGKSPKHWFITELGHNGTEHIHIHGIIFTKTTEERYSKLTGRKYTQDTTTQEIRETWGYGYTFKGTYVNAATINYVVKYCLKADELHKYYKPTILCSPGIGKRYKDTVNAQLSKYKPGETREVYRTPSGGKINLPTYWRNHIYTEEEKEKLWIEKLNKQERWVDGQKVSIENDDYTKYNQLLKYAHLKNKRLGYGDDKRNWSQRQYEEQRRELIHGQRLGNDTENKRTTNEEEQIHGQGYRYTDREIEAARERYTKILQRPETKLKYNNFEDE